VSPQLRPAFESHPCFPKSFRNENIPRSLDR
jgi:hypothetical protein